MTAVERLQSAPNKLGLKAVEARLESLLEQASQQELSYADFLDELLSCEVDARWTRYLRVGLQLAHLPFVKTFDQFDFKFQSSILQPVRFQACLPPYTVHGRLAQSQRRRHLAAGPMRRCAGGVSEFGRRPLM